MKELLRRTWAEIDLDALAQNFREVRKAADPKAMVCCVVKADAYGHGAVRVAREFASLGADWFAVSNLEEALQLRQAGIETPVLVLGYTPADKAGTLSRENISQCVYSLEYARDLSRFAREAGGRGEHPPEDRHRHEPPGLLLPGHQPGRGGGGRGERGLLPAGAGPPGDLHPLRRVRRGPGGGRLHHAAVRLPERDDRVPGPGGGYLPGAALRQLCRRVRLPPVPPGHGPGGGSCSTACTPPGSCAAGLL